MSALIDALSLQALGCPVEVETDHGWLTVMCWETGRLHRLLANHPDRRIDLPEWAQPDFDVICGRTWPVPILPPRRRPRAYFHRGAIARARFPSAERIVEALAATGCMPVVRGAYKWRALCPVCRMRGKVDRRVYVERDPEMGRDWLSTFCHCGIRDILAVLGLGPREAATWNG